jgi:hypothetical protein
MLLFLLKKTVDDYSSFSYDAAALGRRPAGPAPPNFGCGYFYCSIPRRSSAKEALNKTPAGGM